MQRYEFISSGTNIYTINNNKGEFVKIRQILRHAPVPNPFRNATHHTAARLRTCAGSVRASHEDEQNSNARELPPTHKSARTLYLHRKEHQDANKRFSEHHAKPLTHNALAKTSRQEALLRIAEKHVSPYGRASFAVQESLFRTSIKPVPHHGRVSPALRKRLFRKSDPREYPHHKNRSARKHVRKSTLDGS